MTFILLPKSSQNFFSFVIFFLSVFSSAERIHHLFSNNSAKPDWGPLYSVPAIGWEAIQVTSERLDSLIILFISFLEPILPGKEKNDFLKEVEDKIYLENKKFF